MDRRQMIAMTGATALSRLCGPKPPPSREQHVALVRCDQYEQFEARLNVAFDAIGGIEDLVCGKTVAVKLNLAGNPKIWPSENSAHDLSFRTNSLSVQALISLLVKANARRIRILESFFPARQDHALWHNYKIVPEKIHYKGVPIIWENIQNLGNYKNYAQRKIRQGALLYSAYNLSAALFECDVYVSMAKLKEHWIAGVSMSMKNNFGITPCSLYGGDCGRSGNEQPTKERADVLHNGLIPVPAGVGGEVDPYSSRDPGFRIPRIVVDLLQVRPVHLAIVDGVDSVVGGEGPWIPGLQPVHPHVIIAGRNAVSVDAVGIMKMGYKNPAAPRGSPPFIRADNALRLADEAGLGTCDTNKITIVSCFGESASDCKSQLASTFKP